MRYYIIAGETSGDLHGSNLMQHLLQLDPNANIRFWGGDLMSAKGGTLFRHYKETAFMGITDVLFNLNKIFKNLADCKKDLLKFKPDALILIDYPGFNLRIAKFAKQNGIKVHYYISPKVWAWNTKRAFKIKQNVDYLYSILPFELEFFKPYGIVPDYVGNPICDAIEQYPFDSEFKEKHKINKPIIALLPGSRMSELKHVLPKMLSICKYYKEFSLILAGAPHIEDSIYYKYIGNLPVNLIKGQTYDVIKNSHVALVCSGTATLETALLNCPQVVCYKFSSLSYEIGKRVIKVKYISLVNLILNKLAIPELIQNELNENNIKRELDLIIEGQNRERQFTDYRDLKDIVGNSGASLRAAELIYKRVSI